MNLITGATGHVGNVLARALCARGEAVRCLVLPGEDPLSLAGLPVEIARGDVLDPPSLERACRGMDTVYHLAGIISIQPGPDERVRRVNVDGTRNMLAAARAAGVRRLVYTSSIHALRRIPHGTAVDESVPFDCQDAISAYDRSKAEASLVVAEAAGDGLEAVIVCPTGIIGPHDYQTSEMGQLVRTILTRPLVALVDGAYDFVDVRDVAEGLIQAAERGICGQTYILSGQQIGLPDFTARVRRTAGAGARALTFPMRLAEAFAPLAAWLGRVSRKQALVTPYSLATVRSNSVVSCARARRELGYTSRPLDETLVDTVAWWREQKI